MTCPVDCASRAFRICGTARSTVSVSISRRHSLCAMGRTDTAREGPRGPGPGFCRRQRYSRLHLDSAVPPHRNPQVINFKARLVGNEGLLSNNGRIEGSARISSDSAMRCNNCPSRGCANCPMCVRQRDAACNLRHSPHTHKWSRPLFLRTAHICVAQVWGRRQPGVRQKENEEGEGSKGKSPETGTGRNDEGRRPLDAPLVARLHHQMLHIS